MAAVECALVPWIIGQGQHGPYGTGRLIQGALPHS